MKIFTLLKKLLKALWKIVFQHKKYKHMYQHILNSVYHSINYNEWDLELKSITSAQAYWNGKNQQDRIEIFNKLVESYKNNSNAVCLQVGVPSKFK